MANITTYLDSIENAQYGEEVRESIKNSIAAINEESENVVDNQNDVKSRQDVLESRYEAQIAGNTDVSEVIDMRTDADGKTYTNVPQRLNNIDLKIKNIEIDVKDYGVKADGTTDDTIALRTVLNLKDNVIVKIPVGVTIIISDVVAVTKNNVIIKFGSGSKIKLKDSSGVLDKVLDGTYQEPPSLINLFGDSCQIEGAEIDGNLKNNYIEKDGEKYYAMYDASSYNFTKNFGYGGIALCNDNCKAIKCYVHDLSWGGIEKSNLDTSFQATTNYSSGCEIAYCKVNNVGRDGIAFHCATGCSAHDNVLVDNQWHDIHDYVYGENNKIYNNICTYKASNCKEFYPNHHTVQPKNFSIVLDHNSYRASIVKKSEVYNNSIEGEYPKGGIATNGFAEDYTIKNNTIKTNSAGIIATMPLGTCSIESNTITAPIGLIFEHLTPTEDWYPASIETADLNFKLFISKNKFINCTNPIYISIQAATISNYINKGVIYIDKNNFDADNFVNDYDCVNFTNDTLNIDRLEIVIGDNTYKNYKRIYHRAYYYYVNVEDGNDNNTGMSDKPFKTVAKALSMVPRYIDSNNSYWIMLVTDTSENININGIYSPASTNLTIEGWDVTTSSAITRQVGNILANYCNNITLNNLKPCNNTNNSITLNQCNFMELNNIDLTYSNGSHSALYATNNSTVKLNNASIGNCNIGIQLNNLSRCFINNDMSGMNNCGYHFYLNAGSILSSNTASVSSSDFRGVRSGGSMVVNMYGAAI